MTPDEGQLKRELGVPGSVLLGLGSMVGTGVFVAIALAAGVAGSWVIPAILLAACVALCNALSSAQLAAAIPISGGTYEYATRLVHPWAGFGAGWLFLVAKSASAATGALGAAAYALYALGLTDDVPARLVAVILVVLLTALVIGGLKRTTLANAIIVAITLFTLATFFVTVMRRPGTGTIGLASAPGPGVLEAAALIFVAFTGYGRIATLAEEVKDPRRNIPRAIWATIGVVTLIYIAVTYAAIRAVGADMFGALVSVRSDQAPLEALARASGGPTPGAIVATGAVVAMTGVLLNLILGLSRVALAMGRRGDLPAPIGRIASKGHPIWAVLLVGAVIAALALIGNTRFAWSLSAVTVLLYYALTNISALRLAPHQRLYPRCVPVLGLIGCLGLAIWIDPKVWLTGMILLGVGFGVRMGVRLATNRGARDDTHSRGSTAT